MTSSVGDFLYATRSRDATNMLLEDLQRHRFRPRAWTDFAVAATRRSLWQACAHPRAFWQATALHLALGLAAGKRHRAWVGLSWALAASHLGLLEEKSDLGMANAATLIRANLPAIESRLGRWVPVVALTTDVIDGAVARRTGAVTVFGSHADFIADAAVWVWFTFHHEPSRRMRVLTLAAWAAPIAAITVASLATGRMIDLRRSRWLRPSAAVEVIIGARAIRRLLMK